MRAIFLFLSCALFLCCSGNKKEKQAQDSLALPLVTAEVIDTTLDVTFAARPAFPRHSSKLFTNDSLEAIVAPSLDSILDEYSGSKYFSLQAEGKTWYFDQHKKLRALSEVRKNESLKENSIYLFNNNKLIGAYRDVDMRGQDTQTNKERMVGDLCPTCGVKFNLVSYDTAVSVLDEPYMSNLSEYLLKDCNELLDWLAKGTPVREEGGNFIFERTSPYQTRYTVNSELHTKFIKRRAQ